ncbi:hypothetical protein KM427_04985 [Nocardioides sp. LMS-CY]|uniref:hypothetical protein n=1 Tax=Nocardioides sp. (strain LMS-CY) TaxID=2840457 RepID=UPI001BFFE2C3|nr:hypothetical protein [Nocardioides sp. LMS-CY]QWF23088.1 hypothetical protein KM427_04985 [Nocardioides sp. LMS-CY]
MSPLSWPVLIGTLLIGSPALYAAQVSGTLSPDVAVVRLLICLGVVWVGCSVVASLVEGAVAANRRATAEAEAAAARNTEPTAEFSADPTAEFPVMSPEGAV